MPSEQVLLESEAARRRRIEPLGKGRAILGLRCSGLAVESWRAALRITSPWPSHYACSRQRLLWLVESSAPASYTSLVIRRKVVPMLGWFKALMPKEEGFFTLFTQHATIVVAGAE